MTLGVSSALQLSRMHDFAFFPAEPPERDFFDVASDGAWRVLFCRLCSGAGAFAEGPASLLGAAFEAEPAAARPAAPRDVGQGAPTGPIGVQVGGQSSERIGSTSFLFSVIKQG